VEQQPNCAACKILYGGRTPPEDPPCGDCRPILLDENADAIMLYSLVQNQWIMGPSGPVDVNHLAVWEAIDRHEVKDALGTFKKILTLSHWMLGRINDKREP
jgi:hypothetical protein